MHRTGTKHIVRHMQKSVVQRSVISKFTCIYKLYIGYLNVYENALGELGFITVFPWVIINKLTEYPVSGFTLRLSYEGWFYFGCKNILISWMWNPFKVTNTKGISNPWFCLGYWTYSIFCFMIHPKLSVELCFCLRYWTYSIFWFRIDRPKYLSLDRCFCLVYRILLSWCRIHFKYKLRP